MAWRFQDGRVYHGERVFYDTRTHNAHVDNSTHAAGEFIREQPVVFYNAGSTIAGADIFGVVGLNTAGNYTLPSLANIDAVIRQPFPDVADTHSWMLSVIKLTAGNCTILANTGSIIVGSPTITGETNGRFLVIHYAGNYTFVRVT